MIPTKTEGVAFSDPVEGDPFQMLILNSQGEREEENEKENS